MTEEKLHHADREMLCANCARPVTLAQVEWTWAGDMYGFMDDPPFCSQVCAHIWHDTHLDICDDYGEGG
jgi:endogenous inhibitor of DNA gyrase (YacG/DUF329 family)